LLGLENTGDSGQRNTITTMEVEEVGQLQQIFPTWDKQSLLALLQANGMNMDRTVEAIFIIEGARENGEEIVITEEPEPPVRSRPQNSGQARNGNGHFGDAVSVENEFYRGLRIKLPDDFLRVSSQRHLLEMI
jgi:hypothetical protein